MAPSSFILITLFSLAMVASITKARVVPGHYNNWQGAAKDAAMVEAIKHLMHEESTTISSEKDDCHTSSDNQNKKGFVRDFDPRPNLSAYPDDTKPKRETAFNFIKDFEPRPDATAYPEEDAGLETEKEFVKDFEPRPNISAYQG